MSLSRKRDGTPRWRHGASEDKRGALKFRCPAAALICVVKAGRNVTVMPAARPMVMAESSVSRLRRTVVFLLRPHVLAHHGSALTGVETLLSVSIQD